MTRDDIIRMAREVGILDFRDEDNSEYVKDVLDDLERFASLVAADEREVCAQAAWDFVQYEVHADLADQVAAAILARSTP